MMEMTGRTRTTVGARLRPSRRSVRVGARSSPRKRTVKVCPRSRKVELCQRRLFPRADPLRRVKPDRIAEVAAIVRAKEVAELPGREESLLEAIDLDHDRALAPVQPQVAQDLVQGLLDLGREVVRGRPKVVQGPQRVVLKVDPDQSQGVVREVDQDAARNLDPVVGLEAGAVAEVEVAPGLQRTTRAVMLDQLFRGSLRRPKVTRSRLDLVFFLSLLSLHLV